MDRGIRVGREPPAELPRSIETQRPPTQPQDPIPAQWPADPEGPEDFPRAGWKRRADERCVRPNSGSIPRRVLEYHDKANGPAVLVSEDVPFRVGSSELVLQVICATLDLRVNDLLGAEEADVAGFSVRAHEHLELGMPNRMRLADELLSELELTGVSQRRPTSGIRAESEVETNRFSHRTARCDANFRVAKLNAHRRRPGDAGQIGDLLVGQGELEPRTPDLAADTAALLRCPLPRRRGSACHGTDGGGRPLTNPLRADSATPQASID